MGGATTDEVIADLCILKTRLLQDMNLSHFILFGSRARGDWLQTSDADLVVVSERFHGVKFNHRPEIVLEHWSERVDLEVLCYTDDEFERLRQRRCIVQAAAEEGIEV
jgi:predicted nucleotidyltransferase